MYCSEQLGVLAPESEWISYLISFQMAKVLLLTAWDLKLQESQLQERQTLSFDEKEAIKIVSGSMEHHEEKGKEGSKFLDEFVDKDLESFKQGIQSIEKHREAVTGISRKPQPRLQNSQGSFYE